MNNQNRFWIGKVEVMLNSYDDNQREKCLERKNPTREQNLYNKSKQNYNKNAW